MIRKNPGVTAKYRAKRRRAEAPVAKKVREKCVERDGHCRLAPLGGCEGPSEWSHIGANKRARTRGMKPERRHTTAGSMMLCRKHHGLYDSGIINVSTTEAGADGDSLMVWGRTFTGLIRFGEFHP
jgi:hypothetical protein